MELMKIKDVIAATTMSRSTIYAKINDGFFPQQVRLSKRRVAWRKADIEEWQADPFGYRHKHNC